MKVIATYAMLYMCVFAQAKEVKSLQSPRQWHVSISGNDSADGSATAPLRHIQMMIKMVLFTLKVLMPENMMSL